MRIGICEDNPIEATALLSIIDRWSTANRLSVATRVFSSAEDFLLHKTEFEYDMLFLDIQMGNIDGMQLAQMIRAEDEHVILVFLTALREFSIQGYEVNAFRYLVKPVEEAACSLVLDKVHQLIDAQRDRFLVLGKDNARERFALKDIYYIDTMGHYIIVHSRSGEHRFRGNLMSVEKMRLPYLVRCHRTTLVNIQYVNLINRDLVQLSDAKKTILPLAKPYWEGLNLSYLDYYGR